MFLSTLFLSLAIGSALGGDPTRPEDCGKSGDIAHFKNIVLAFADKNGKPVKTVDFPGSITITSGQVCIQGAPANYLKGSILQIDVKKKEGWLGWVDFCPLLGTAGVSCSQDLCAILQKAEGKDICAMLANNGCYDITNANQFPVSKISLPGVPAILAKLADGQYQVSGKLVMADKKTEIGCIQDLYVTAYGD